MGYLFRTGANIVGASIMSPRIASKNLVSIMFLQNSCHYDVILAFIMAFIMSSTSNLPTSLVASDVH